MKNEKIFNKKIFTTHEDSANINKNFDNWIENKLNTKIPDEVTSHRKNCLLPINDEKDLPDSECIVNKKQSKN